MYYDNSHCILISNFFYILLLCRVNWIKIFYWWSGILQARMDKYYYPAYYCREVISDWVNDGVRIVMFLRPIII